MINIMEENRQKNSKSPDPETLPCCLSERWKLAYMGFLGFICFFAVRVNISMSLPCMIKPITSHNTYYSQNMTKDNTMKELTESCYQDFSNSSFLNENYEFHWSKEKQSFALSAFYYGYLTTQVAAGTFADRFGGRRVIAVSMTMAGICTVLTPLSLRHSFIVFIALRILVGVTTGAVWPSMNSMWGRWAPKSEKSQLTASSLLGSQIGIVLTFSVSGFLCETRIDKGWQLIFYFTGILTIIWVGPWLYVTAETPRKSRRISQIEKDFIEKNSGTSSKMKMNLARWKSVLTSGAVFAAVTAQFCHCWLLYTVLSGLTLYMKEVLRFNIKSNGLLSALPFICKIVSVMLASRIADFIRGRFLSSTITRKLFTISGLIGSFIPLVIAGFLSCKEKEIVVFLMCVAMFFSGFQSSGCMTNYIDFAPRYGGVVYGLQSTIGNIPGFVAPLVFGILTPYGTQQEWQSVFYVCGGIGIYGVIIFSIFGQGELQSWAKDDETLDSQCDGEKSNKNNNLNLTTVWTIKGTNNFDA